ncbi:MAG: alanine--glyoxylate aminotransferase family protein [Cyclobacteriaceae bacterium]|nr:alanine--glyoxylate aminotransferase family protein [Cyclobacteriaceae bacterium HetDA_MAG_MS6]
MISFYPGPSRVYSKVTEYIYEAYMDGIMSINHRSQDFMKLYADTRSVLVEKLDVPEDYQVVFVSAATECWEIIAQSLTRESSQHFHNGAFGKKWAEYTDKLTSQVVSTPFDLNEALPVTAVDLTADVLCVTQCETSNGTYVSEATLKQLGDARNTDQLIAVDATSSLGGVDINLRLADVWFASVQKCFGLPAGMAIMILSPDAVRRAEVLADKKHYNSLLWILENASKNQSHHTPNVLDIYLLYRTQLKSKGIAKTDHKLTERLKYWDQFFEDLDYFEWLVENPALRSKTVMALKCPEPEKVKKKARNADFVIGNGYGPWREDTIRIANFPAIKGKEIEGLSKLLRKYFN